MDWIDPLVRGLVALAATAGLFMAARLRFGTKEDHDGGPADIGLD